MRSITLWVACYVVFKQLTVMFITLDAGIAASVDCQIIGDLPLRTVQNGTPFITSCGAGHLDVGMAYLRK